MNSDEIVARRSRRSGIRRALMIPGRGTHARSAVEQTRGPQSNRASSRSRTNAPAPDSPCPRARDQKEQRKSVAGRRSCRRCRRPRPWLRRRATGRPAATPRTAARVGERRTDQVHRHGGEREEHPEQPAIVRGTPAGQKRMCSTRSSARSGGRPDPRSFCLRAHVAASASAHVITASALAWRRAGGRSPPGHQQRPRSRSSPLRFLATIGTTGPKSPGQRGGIETSPRRFAKSPC